MASSPSSSTSSTDSGYVSDPLGLQFADSTKDIAPWIHPTIRGLCKELGAPATTPHILAGVTTILSLPSPPLSNDGENQKEENKDKIPALIAAVYFYVRARLSGPRISGEEYVSQRKGVLSTLANLRKAKEGINWEGWEKVTLKDVDIWLMEISNRGWSTLDWYKKIVEGAGLEVNGQKERPAEERQKIVEEQNVTENQRIAQKQERLRLAEEKKKLANERNLAQEQDRLRLEKKQRLAKEQQMLAEKQRLAQEEEEELAKEQKLAEEREQVRVAEERKLKEMQEKLIVAEKERLANEREIAEKTRLKLVEDQEKLAKEQELAKKQEMLRREKKERLAKEQEKLMEEQKLAEEREQQRLAKMHELAEQRTFVEEHERQIVVEERSLADEQLSPAEERQSPAEESPVEEELADEQESPVEKQRFAGEQEMLAEQERLAQEEQERLRLAEELEKQRLAAEELEKQRAAEAQKLAREQRVAEKLVVELNSCLKRKRDARESPPCQKKRKVNENDDTEDDDTENDDTVDDDLVDVHEQQFYKITNSGEERLRVIPIDGAEPWDSLLSKESTTLDGWKYNIGESVYVRCAGKSKGLAKISDIKELGPECDVLVLAWYYKRDGIQEELGGEDIIKERQAHLDKYWPPGEYTRILSSNRTINTLNALCGKASPEVMAKLCPDKFYITTNSIKPTRKIYMASNPKYAWMKKLLHLESKEGMDCRPDDSFISDADSMSDIQLSATPEPSTPRNIQNSAACASPSLPPREGVDPRPDDCLIPSADAMLDIQPSTPDNIQNSAPCASHPLPLTDNMSDIQPSAMPEPSTPHNMQNSAACASSPLPLREEILANADESPTVPTTLNQTTSCVASPIANEEATSSYIEEFNHLYEIGFFNADATTELPLTPYNIDGVPQTISTTSDQTSVESSNISPSITVSLHDIEGNKKVHNSEKSAGEQWKSPLEWDIPTAQNDLPLGSELDWNNWTQYDIRHGFWE